MALLSDPGRLTGGLLCAALCGAAPAALAQQTGRGGVELSFDLSQRVQATRNLDLDPVSQGTTFRADTQLGFSALSETRTDRIFARASGALRAVEAPGTAEDESFGFADPDLALSYLRRGATARFEFDARLATREIAFLDAADFLAPDGTPVLPEDLEDLRGTGTRQQARISAALRGGEGGPFGYGLRAAYTRVDYSDVSSASLFDSDRLDLGADLRLDVAADRRVTLGARYSLYEDDDPATGRRETLGLTAGIAVDRPLGTLSLALGADVIEEGTRFTVSTGLDRALPLGGVTLRIGATRSAGGELGLTGEAGFARELPLGRIGARLSRSYSAGANDAETLVTSVSADWQQELTPLAGVTLDIAYIDSQDTRTDETLSTASLGATFSYALTPDWSLDLGYRRRFRNDEAAGTGWASSDTVYLGVGRSFRGSY